MLTLFARHLMIPTSVLGLRRATLLSQKSISLLYINFFCIYNFTEFSVAIWKAEAFTAITIPYNSDILGKA